MVIQPNHCFYQPKSPIQSSFPWPQLGRSSVFHHYEILFFWFSVDMCLVDVALILQSYFLMFKSSVQGISTKKSAISFVKSLGSPKQADRTSYLQTSKSISTVQNECLNECPRKGATVGSLSIEIATEKCFRPQKLLFTYAEETTVQELIQFMRRETKENFIYFKAKNINLEYFLTLPQKRVADLNTKRLELTGVKIRIDCKGSLLYNFEIIKCLGTGGFSRVYLVRGFGMLMAMKVINKNFIIDNEKENIVESQRRILEKCNGHPFVTKLYMSFQTSNCLIFCMEYCNGGQLFNLLRKVKRMKQSQAKFYFVQTLIAISHLHSMKILYRDLKPENIIIDCEGHLRLADYGLSKVMTDDMTYSFCGSAEYMAPEMLLKKGHGFEIDYYCLGALLYELIFGLPPYYSRDQNELFSNILNNELEFPPFVEISQDLQMLLRRLLEKDAQLRFKTAEEILASPWLSDCKVEDVLAKRIQPPFKTQMFENNFDDADFIQQQKVEILMLEKEKDYGKLPVEQTYFHGFTYIDEQLAKMEQEIQKASEKKLDFTKKHTQPIVLNTKTNKQILWRNGSMKSIDNSQIFAQHINHNSPRMQGLNRSNDKFKVLTSQSSQLSSNPSLLSAAKASEIINPTRGSQNFNCSGSKISNFRRVPQIDKPQQLCRSNDRFGSPININNYINIYTCKSPTHQASTVFASNNYVSPQAKKTFSYGNVSYEKSINSSYKNTSNIYNSISSCAQRPKFSSSEKPILTTVNASSFLHKNSASSQSATQINRGYLSNFKERFNPNQKIKKSYKNTDKMNFNFFTAATPYKHG